MAPNMKRKLKKIQVLATVFAQITMSLTESVTLLKVIFLRLNKCMRKSVKCAYINCLLVSNSAG